MSALPPPTTETDSGQRRTHARFLAIKGASKTSSPRTSRFTKPNPSLSDHRACQPESKTVNSRHQRSSFLIHRRRRWWPRRAWRWSSSQPASTMPSLCTATTSCCWTLPPRRHTRRWAWRWRRRGAVMIWRSSSPGSSTSPLLR
ncbi:Os03g0804250 [Oryza sativa Japonica Group]|uniref:Os03g0804250 protein n=1 Tax=Oryza sativa subsp. japonica TaxID=39947 RepID=A0A0P0W4M5_ORYSJ|nr:Os03g0804250 [Oryza sativa Japonica Group]